MPALLCVDIGLSSIPRTVEPGRVFRLANEAAARERAHGWKPSNPFGGGASKRPKG